VHRSTVAFILPFALLKPDAMTLETASAPVLPVFQRGLLLLAAMLAMFGWLVMSSRIMSDLHPIWDLASHVSWHTWLALSIVLLAASLAIQTSNAEKRLRWWHRFIMVAPPWLYLTLVCSPWTVIPFAANDANAKGLKILSWNVWVMNKTPDLVVKLIEENKADVVVMLEVGIEQSTVYKQLEQTYPYSYWIPETSSRGIAVLSRIKGTQFRVIDLADQGMPAIEAEIPETSKHSGFHIIGVHTQSPGLRKRTLTRNRQLQSLSEWAGSLKTKGVIIGDLNITPWSPPFSRMLQQGNLFDSRDYRGNYASWPTDLGVLGIPIDHALVTKGTTILHRDVGALAPDSDHRPITLVVQ
jgi:endonuclease/exonuclease/phosphatase (EEP) superfamily protein YafD